MNRSLARHTYTSLHNIMAPKLLLTGLLLLTSILWAEAETNYMPRLQGLLRTRYESTLSGDGGRFQVRNARVTLSGNVAPIINYFIQTDLCDRGKMKILDAWGRIELSQHMAFQAGQFRVPFGTDCFRAPVNYIFSNRSFIGKQMCNVRAVGAKLTYTLPLPKSQVLTLEGGAFNPTAIADHDVRVKQLGFAGKIVYGVDKIKIASGIQSISPDSVRVNLWDASATWTPGRWTFEGEYMHKHYTHHSHRTTQGWLLWADYAMPVKAGVFNQASFHARWDGMTPHSEGKRAHSADAAHTDTSVKLATTHVARNRITAGATLTYSYKAVRCDLRLDYEKYFYHHGAVIDAADNDKICAEMVIRF